jgi:hypothetical protein
MAINRSARPLHRSERLVRWPALPVAGRGFARPGAPVRREPLIRRRVLSRRPGRCHASVCAKGRSVCDPAASPVAARPTERRGAAEQRSLAWRWCRSAVVAGSVAFALVGCMISPKPVAPAELGALPEVPPAPAAQVVEKADDAVALGEVAQGETGAAQVETEVAEGPEVPARVRQAIDNATRVVGVDAAYLMVVAACESRFDPEARAHRTSAVGLYQFTTATWLRAVKMFGARHGLGDYADLITIHDDGLVSMKRGADRRELLRLRKDPELAALMAAELARDNAQRLERILGRAVTPAETYMAHLFGVVPAARMIDAAHSAPGVSGAHLLPTAARTNPHLFSAAGAPASAGDIVTRIGADFKHRAAQVSASI